MLTSGFAPEARAGLILRERGGRLSQPWGLAVVTAPTCAGDARRSSSRSGCPTRRLRARCVPLANDRHEGNGMTTVMIFHEVDDVDHWLRSPKRQEFFGPLGMTVRTFVDPDKTNRVGLIVEVPDLGHAANHAGHRSRSRRHEVRRCSSRDHRDAHRVVTLTQGWRTGTKGEPCRTCRECTTCQSP